MTSVQDINEKEKDGKIIEHEEEHSQQLNMRIRLILQSFNHLLPTGKIDNPDPGQKSGK